MAYGKFTGYEPIPGSPGAYSFTLENGSSAPFVGPEAEQLKSRLDASNAVTQTAGIDSVGGYGSENTPPTPDQIASFRSQLQGGGQPPPTAGPPQQAPGGQLGYGLRVSPQGTIQKYQPGTRGVTKADLEAGETNKVAQSRGETDVVQGGTPQDQAYLDTRAEENIDARLAAQAEGDRVATAAEAESQLAAQQFEQQKRLAAEEAARQADLQNKLKGEEALTNKAFQEYTSSKVNPNRIFSNPGVALVGALAAGAGAYAATIAKTPNFAQQVIDQAIDRDIHAQEAAIRLKGDAANNLLSNLRQTGLSLEQSRSVARGIQLQYSAAQLQALKAKNAVPALQSHYENLDLALQKSLTEANEQSRIASLDKVTRQTSKSFERPHAGSAGGFVDVGDQLGTASKIQALKKGEQELNKGEKGPAASPEVRQAAGAVAETDVLADLASKYGPNEGLPSYEARTIFGKTWEDFANKVAGQGAGISADTAVKRQDLARIQSGLSSANSVLGGQGAMTGEEQKIFAAGMAPGATWGDVQRAIAQTNDRAKARGSAAQVVGEAGGSVVTK